MMSRREDFDGQPVWPPAPLFPLEKILAVWFLLLVVLVGNVAMRPSDGSPRRPNPERVTFIGP